MLLASPSAVWAEGDGRVVVVRERSEASVLDGALQFQLMKLRGYSIDLKINGDRQTLKLGEAFSAADGTCDVVFEEVSPETRIARFRTTCP